MTATVNLCQTPSAFVDRTAFVLAKQSTTLRHFILRNLRKNVQLEPCQRIYEYTLLFLNIAFSSQIRTMIVMIINTVPTIIR